jgi:hypothetical protein
VNCKEVQELLPAYDEKALTGQETVAVKGHLAGCMLCQKECERFSAAWTMLGVLEPIVPSPAFRANFWARVRQEEEKPAGWFAFPRFIPVMAGFVGIWVAGVGLGAFIFMHSNSAIPMIRPSAWTGPSLTDAYFKRVGRI